MDYKKQAWIVSGCLVLILLSWVLYAVHNSAVAEARSARASKSDSKSNAGSNGCPFSSSPQPQTKKKSCCEGGNDAEDSMKSNKNENAEAQNLPVDQSQSQATSNPNPAVKSLKFEEMKDLSEEELQALMKQFTPEQLAKCPHLAAKSHKKKK